MPPTKTKKGDLGAQLHTYLQSKNSPLASHVDSIIRAGNRYRIDPRLIVAISGGETSFATNGNGPRVYNAWGIGPGRSYKSWDDGIDSVAKLLREGYVGQGLTSLAAIQRKWAPLGAGNDPSNLNSNWIRTNGTFYSELGGNPANVTGNWRNAAAPTYQGKPVPARPVKQLVQQGQMQMPEVKPDYGPVRQVALENLAAIAAGKKVDPLDMLGGFTGARLAVREKYLADQEIAKQWLEQQGHFQQPQQQPGGTKAAEPAPTTTKMLKGMLLPGTSWKGTHITDGLDWNNGARTAQDIMARAGTQVGAPENGTIIRHGSAQGGQSLYFKADSGHLYWMGHIENALPVNTHVKRGQRIALISPDHAHPHLHIDRKR